MSITQGISRYAALLAGGGLAYMWAAVFPMAASAAPDIFARFTVDRNGIFAGEEFGLTLTLYAAGHALGKQISISGLPPADQLQLTPFQELAIGTAIQEGRSYETRPFRCRARAAQPRKIVIAPGLQGTIEEITRSYFFVQHSQRPVSIPVEPLALEIRPLPEAGRPASFSGAVGRFAFTASAAPLDVSVGDLVTVTFRIAGEGLPDTLPSPSVPETPGFRIYAAQRVPEESSGAQRVFRQTVVPTEAAAGSIPAVAFTYFDARAERYRTESAGPFPLTFHADRAPVQPIYVPPPSTATTSSASRPKAVPMPPAPGRFERLKNRLLARKLFVVSGPDEVTIRLAPSESARPLFTLKPGVAVSVESTVQGWSRITCREGIGWVPEKNIETAH